MRNIGIMEISRLKLEIQNEMGVNIHIHDTCSGFSISLDAPNAAVSKRIVDFMSEHGESVAVSDDGLYFNV